MRDEADVKRLATLEAVALAPARLVYSVWIALAFLAVGVAALVLLALLPGVARRRAAARAAARAFLRLAGMPLRVKFLERLPPGQCVVVCNHASYLDGIVLAAALPPRFGFVVKREMAGVPLAGVVLRRLGSEFVERFDRQRGATDARRVLRNASNGQSLVFFPEGTFTRTPGLLKFHTGAFVTAARVGCPVGPAVVRGTRRALPRLQRRGRARRVARLEGTHRRHLSLLLFLARADQLRALVLIERVRSREEGVDADDRQRAVVLARLVVERLLLDLAALIHALHGAEHAAALRELLELLIDRLLHQLRQVLAGARALPRVLDLVEAELAIDDELNRDRAPYALLGRRGERLVVGIGVQAVAVVEQRIEGLQRRADVVEGDLARVQAPARGLHVVLEHLAARARAVALAHGPR